jgi:hypothetical protein
VTNLLILIAFIGLFCGALAVAEIIANFFFKKEARRG